MPKTIAPTANQRVDIEIRVRVANGAATLRAHVNVANKKPVQMSRADWDYVTHILDETKKVLVPA